MGDRPRKKVNIYLYFWMILTVACFWLSFS